MLSTSDRKLYERYIDGRDDFSLVSTNDPSARRDAKIARYKQEHELKLKLEVYRTPHFKERSLIDMPVYRQSPIGASR